MISTPVLYSGGSGLVSSQHGDGLAWQWLFAGASCTSNKHEW